MSSSALIIGGSGKVARHLTRLLASQNYTVHSLIRNPAQIPDIKALGGTPIVQSIEDASVAELKQTIRSAAPGVVIWSAGAGGGSPERTETVDHLGAVKSFDAVAEAAAEHGTTRRYVIVSAIDVRDKSKGEPGWYDEADEAVSQRTWGAIPAYMQAKFEADRDLVTNNARRGLEYTIVRPGWLGLEPGTGKVAAGKVHLSAQIQREDVARVIAAVIKEPGTIGLAFDVVGGETPIQEAVKKVAEERVNTFEGHY